MTDFSRIESIGAYVPERAVSTNELLGRLPDEVSLDIEAITGIHSRRVAGTSSLDLALRAADDALNGSRYGAADLDVVISCSITRTVEPGCFTLEPSLALRICQEIGATAALHFDITNACAGVLTGIKVLDAMIRSGAVRTGLVVSGEDITPISETAIAEITLPYDPQFASLTVGDAASAAILDVSVDPADRIEYIELFTAAEFAEACLGMPSDQRPGVALYTDNRVMHNESRYLLWMNRHRDFLADRGSTFADEGYDVMVHHQVSAPGIAFVQTIAEREFGTPMPPHLNVLDEYANTASTSHLLVLAKYLRDKEIRPGSRVLLIPAASGVVGGFISTTMHDLVEQEVAR
ncbi:3-oxoacyl-[acyl-carrier-protein] synthase III C-terminal domain-containing protein [Gordonia sp. CPCC 205515]|uniref:3-oxoacyl-ACP synthase III family protein n=1 Tax=Gordonia sp. CPCC 205515 TaxID=3140791 RepID=UPI003AF39508